MLSTNQFDIALSAVGTIYTFTHYSFALLQRNLVGDPDKQGSRDHQGDRDKVGDDHDKRSYYKSVRHTM